MMAPETYRRYGPLPLSPGRVFISRLPRRITDDSGPNAFVYRSKISQSRTPRMQAYYFDDFDRYYI